MSVSPHSPHATQLRTKRDFEDVGSMDSANSPLRCGVQIQNNFNHNPQTLVPLNQVPGKGVLKAPVVTCCQKHNGAQERGPCEDEGLLASGWWGRRGVPMGPGEGEGASWGGQGGQG